MHPEQKPESPRPLAKSDVYLGPSPGSSFAASRLPVNLFGSSPGSPRVLKRNYTYHERITAAKMYDEGASITAISNAIGRTLSSTRNLLGRLGKLPVPCLAAAPLVRKPVVAPRITLFDVLDARIADPASRVEWHDSPLAQRYDTWRTR